MDITIHTLAASSSIVSLSRIPDLTALTLVGPSPTAQIDLTPLTHLQRVTFSHPLDATSIRHVIFPTRHVRLVVQSLCGKTGSVPPEQESGNAATHGTACGVSSGVSCGVSHGTGPSGNRRSDRSDPPSASHVPGDSGEACSSTDTARNVGSSRNPGAVVGMASARDGRNTVDFSFTTPADVWTNPISVEIQHVLSYQTCLVFLHALQGSIREVCIEKYIPFSLTYEPISFVWTRPNPIPLLVVKQVATFVPDDVFILKHLLDADMQMFERFRVLCKAQRTMANTFADHEQGLLCYVEHTEYSPLPFVDLSKATMIAYGQVSLRGLDKENVNHLYLYRGAHLSTLSALPVYALTLHGLVANGPTTYPSVCALMLRYVTAARLQSFPSLQVLILSDATIEPMQDERTFGCITLHASHESYHCCLETNMTALQNIRAHRLCIKVSQPISQETRAKWTRWGEERMARFGSFVFEN